MRDPRRGGRRLVVAEHGPLRIALGVEQPRDLVGIGRARRQAVADDEQLQFASGASILRRDAQHRFRAFEDFASGILHHDLHRMIAHVLVRRRHRPAPRFRGANVASDFKLILLGMLGEHDVVVVKADRHTGHAIPCRGQGELK